jgi:hypothetical protein
MVDLEDVFARAAYKRLSATLLALAGNYQLVLLTTGSLADRLYYIS